MPMYFAARDESCPFGGWEVRSWRAYEQVRFNNAYGDAKERAEEYVGFKTKQIADEYAKILREGAD